MSEPLPEPSPESSNAKDGKDAAKGADATASRPKQPLDDLPHVESPSISPVGDEVKKEEAQGEPEKSEAAAAPDKPEAVSGEATEPARVIAFPRLRLPDIRIGRRARRAAANAAVIAVAAGIGAIASALAINSLTPAAPTQNVASIAEQQAMQKSIAVLAREVSALKANLDGASKSSQSQAAKTTARIDSAKPAEQQNDIVTGSIASPASALPATIAAATAAAITAPLPQPRPQIVQGWSAHLSPDGRVIVEQHNGDLYEVSTGVPLPGLGRVEAINRDGGRIEVVTAKGIVTSPPRRTVRNRSYRFPPYFDPY